MKEKCKIILLLVSLCSILFFSLFQTKEVVSHILLYTDLFVKKVFPTSFLFFLLSTLLLEYQFVQVLQKIFKRNSVYFYFLILTMISGFPSGAIYVREELQRGMIDQDMGNHILLYTHFPNPLFVLYTVSLSFQKPVIIPFYGILLLSNFLIYCFIPKKKSFSSFSIKQYQDFSIVLSKTILKVSKTILLIYGTSLFFYLVSVFLSPIFSSIPLLYVFFVGVFDLTNGVVSTSLLGSDFIRGIFLFFFLVLGSFSIHMQVKSILSDTSLSYHSFVKGRIVSFFLCILLWIIYCGCTVTIR